MHVVVGKQTRRIDTTAEIRAWAAPYQDIVVDLGTGDGCYVRHLAAAHPTVGWIGVDLCHANLRETARRAPANALFIIADALAIPAPLHGMAGRVTIEFPWGSLLRGLVDGDRALVDGIAALGKPGVALDLDICLNAGAVAEAGWSLEAGANALLGCCRTTASRSLSCTGLAKRNSAACRRPGQSGSPSGAIRARCGLKRGSLSWRRTVPQGHQTDDRNYRAPSRHQPQDNHGFRSPAAWREVSPKRIR